MDMLSKDIIEYLDSRYVQKDDCATRHQRTEEEIKEISIAQASLISKQEFGLKLQWVTLTAAISTAATVIGALIIG